MIETLQFLGTSGSMGIPMIGCNCAVCRSKNPHNHRLRPSVLLTINDKKILIDCGPDFHEQALKFGITHLDGVIFTHAHHDHTAGIDELRVYHHYNRKPVPCLLSVETARDLKRRFYYLFDSEENSLATVPRLDLNILPSNSGSCIFLGSSMRYFTYEQGGMAVNGFRIGSLAYVTDIKHYPDSILEDLQGLDHLIISALRFTPSHLHFSVDEAVDFAQMCKAKQTWFTHMSHELDHEHTNAYLPPNVKIAYDGLILNFNAEFLQ